MHTTASSLVAIAQCFSKKISIWQLTKI